MTETRTAYQHWTLTRLRSVEDPTSEITAEIKRRTDLAVSVMTPKSGQAPAGSFAEERARIVAGVAETGTVPSPLSSAGYILNGGIVVGQDRRTQASKGRGTPSAAQPVKVTRLTPAEPKAPRPARKAPAAELVEGTYKNEDQVIRVTRSREGRLYGKVWADGSFEYKAGLLRGLTPGMLMTLDEAKAFGKQWGTCCMCARTLTNPESIDKGIGPICERGF